MSSIVFVLLFSVSDFSTIWNLMLLLLYFFQVKIFPKKQAITTHTRLFKHRKHNYFFVVPSQMETYDLVNSNFILNDQKDIICLNVYCRFVSYQPKNPFIDLTWMNVMMVLSPVQYFYVLFFIYYLFIHSVRGTM